MKYQFHSKSGMVEADGAELAHLKATSPTDGLIRSSGEKDLTYKVYGPFGQGYNIGLFEKKKELTTLAYNWRDGAWLHLVESKQGLWFQKEDILRGEHVIGQVKVTDKTVLVTLSEPTAPLQDKHVAFLLVLDVQWAKRIMMFKKD